MSHSQFHSPDTLEIIRPLIKISRSPKMTTVCAYLLTKSDLLVINKTDLAPYVGASLEVMDRDSKMMRGDRPFVFTNLKAQDGVEAVVGFLRTHLHVV